MPLITSTGSTVNPTLEHKHLKTVSTSTNARSVQPSGVPVASFTVSGKQVTITTNNPHQLTTVTEFAFPNLLDGVFRPDEIVNATTFKFTLPAWYSSNDVIDFNDEFLTIPVFAQYAEIVASSGNVGNITIGPNANASYYTMVPGKIYAIPNVPGYKFDLSKWFFKPANSGDSVEILFV